MYYVLVVNAVVFLTLCDSVEEKPTAKQNRGERPLSVLEESPVWPDQAQLFKHVWKLQKEEKKKHLLINETMKSESSDLFCNLSNFNPAIVLTNIKIVFSVESVHTVGGETHKPGVCQTALLMILKDKNLANWDLFSFCIAVFQATQDFTEASLKFSCSLEALGRNCRCWIGLFLCFSWQCIKKIIQVYYTSSHRRIYDCFCLFA